MVSNHDNAYVLLVVNTGLLLNRLNPHHNLKTSLYHDLTVTALLFE